MTLTQDEFCERFKGFLFEHSPSRTPEARKGLEEYALHTGSTYWRAGGISPEECADEDMRCR